MNVRIQDHCWARLVGHVGLILDGAVYSGVRQALAGRTSIRLLGALTSLRAKCERWVAK